jgi:hypothetical protein
LDRVSPRSFPPRCSSPSADGGLWCEVAGRSPINLLPLGAKKKHSFIFVGDIVIEVCIVVTMGQRAIELVSGPSTGRAYEKVPNRPICDVWIARPAVSFYRSVRDSVRCAFLQNFKAAQSAVAERQTQQESGDKVRAPPDTYPI